MPDIKSILCPVDFSVLSRHALQHAVQLARWYNSTLTVMHVYAMPIPPAPVLYGGSPAPLSAAPFPPLPVSPQQAHDDALAELGRLQESVDISGVKVRLHAQPGSPVRDILDEANTSQIDLIVMGTHGLGGFDRWMLGSVAEKVLRKASCPVLTVPPPVGDPAGDALLLLKRILCPLDFSEASLKALERALSLAKEADAELHLMHVIEGLPDAREWQALDSPSIAEYLRLREHDARERLRAVMPADASAWCRPEQIVTTGKPYSEILKVARERDAHLIVMGVHGRHVLDRLFFGSTTQHVVRAATCPVLTIRG